MAELTVGDVRPLLTLAANNPLLDDSASIASQLRGILTGFGVPITPELEATLTLIESNPVLISAGTGEFRSAIANLPDSTLLSEVSGLGGSGGGDGSTGGDTTGGTPEITKDANGNDVQTFTLPFSGTTIAINGDNVSVTLPGAQPQVLVGLERLEFTDGTLFLDVKEGAGLVKAAYDALLGTDKSDAAGFDFWVDLYKAGTIDTFKLTNAFTQTEAFTQQYGAVLNDSEALVSSLYQNLLKRQVDADGLAFWKAYLDSNGIAETVDDALAYMMQSEEFAALVGTSFSDGIFV